jgi:hypothetical protein
MKKAPKRPASPKPHATARQNFTRLEDIPNVGAAVAAHLRQLGIAEPSDLLGRDPFQMYDDLCFLTGQRHDPCLLDTFIAAVRFMQGEPKKPWWKYTGERKKVLVARSEGKPIKPKGSDFTGTHP